MKILNYKLDDADYILLFYLILFVVLKITDLFQFAKGTFSEVKEGWVRIPYCPERGGEFVMDQNTFVK